MDSARKIAISVTPFEGDPNKFSFFEEQINSIINLNKLENHEALVYVKSKLTGAALQYYIESPILQNITNVNEFLTNLKNFFVPHVKSTAVHELQHITMLPNENIQSLAHRISCLTKIVYPNITHDESLQNLMLVSLLNAIPNSIKVKLVEANCKTFTQAVAHAETLFQVYARHNILNFLVDTPSTVTNEIAQLQAEVNHLKAHNVNSSSLPDAKTPHSPEKRQFHKNRNTNLNFVKKNKYKNSQQQYTSNNRKPIVCHYCNKVGHTLNRCFKFKRDKSFRRGAGHSGFRDQHQNHDPVNKCNQKRNSQSCGNSNATSSTSLCCQCTCNNHQHLREHPNFQ